MCAVRHERSAVQRFGSIWAPGSFCALPGTGSSAISGTAGSCGVHGAGGFLARGRRCGCALTGPACGPAPLRHLTAGARPARSGRLPADPGRGPDLESSS